MKKINKKMINVIATAALVAGVAAPVVPVGTQVASAQSQNSVDRVLAVEKDFNFNTSTNIPVLTVKEDTVFPSDFKAGDTFRLVLPSTAEWNSRVVTQILNQNSKVKSALIINDQTLEITLAGSGDLATGVEQTETLTVPTGTYAAGTLSVTVTGANVGGQGVNTKTVSVTLTGTPNQDTVAAAIEAALDGNVEGYTTGVATNVITLTADAKRANDTTLSVTIAANTDAGFATAVNSVDGTAGARDVVAINNSGQDVLNFPLNVKLKDASGDLKVTVDRRDSGVTGGEYTFATAASGKTVTVVESVKTVGDTGTLGTIRIDETRVGALNSGTRQKIELRLPPKFKFVAGGKIVFAGGFSGVSSVYDKTNTSNTFDTGGVDIDSAVLDNGKIVFYADINGASTRGSIYIQDAQIEVDGQPAYGDIELNVSGEKLTSADVVVAKYADYGVTVKVDGDAKTVVAGVATAADLKLQKLQIKESLVGSIIDNRKTRIEFPSFVKITDAVVTDASGFSVSAATIQSTIMAGVDGKKNYVEFILPTASGSTAKRDLKIEFKTSVEANKSGDITAKLTGRQGVEGEVVLGKAVAPVTVSATKTNVKVGVKDQAIGEITILETDKGRIDAEETLTVALPEGIKWGTLPKVEVAEGNAEVDTVEKDSTNANVLNITFKHGSTKASKLVLSGAKIDLDRTIPEGTIEAKVGGLALVKNDKAQGASATALDSGEFETAHVAKVVVADVVTPAPGQVKATASFVIDSATYKVDGVEKTADVAPFIQDGRTFLPVRFVAEALGVSESNIIWNANTKTVTLIKGDRIAQIQLGSSNLVVNGVSVPMDTKAFVKEGRTVLPLRYAAQALGADVQWDEATRTVTISQ